MKIFRDKKSLIEEISNKKNIAFVPTMGLIHKGHLSLIRKAKKETKNVLVSIYVNPKQFNKNIDFKRYPRNINKDIAILKKTRVKYLYLPIDKDIYSFRPTAPIYIDKFSKMLCGKFRPGHFKGVVNVVNRFIEIIKPRSIFLGMKDFQQLTLIKLHLYRNKISTKVVSCSTIRERNGVALSSRNNMLKKNQIKIVVKIYAYLKDLKKQNFITQSKRQKINIIKKLLLLGARKIDYVECINMKTYNFAKKKSENYNIFISYYIGEVRLIDNL